MGLKTIAHRSLNSLLFNYRYVKKRRRESNRSDKKIAEEAKNTQDKRNAALALQEIEGQFTAEEIQKSVHKSLEETKDNVRKSIDEAKSQIPRYTDVVKNYQEQTLQATREMVINYIEDQRRIIESLFNSVVWIPYFENNFRVYNYWFSPRIPVEIYARTVSNIADNLAASARITNNVIFGNIDLFGSAFERAQQNTRELSRINVNTAKVFEDTARDTASLSDKR
jgi:hypothetical protein